MLIAETYVHRLKSIDSHPDPNEFSDHLSEVFAEGHSLLKSTQGHDISAQNQ